MKVYEEIASRLLALRNCRARGNFIWADRHEAVLREIEREYLPSGAGFDQGTKIDRDASNDHKLVFNTAYHHMDQHGFYDGWSEHVVKVRPSLALRFVVSVSGANKRGVKGMVADTFEQVLNSEYVQKPAVPPPGSVP